MRDAGKKINPSIHNVAVKKKRNEKVDIQGPCFIIATFGYKTDFIVMTVLTTNHDQMSY